MFDLLNRRDHSDYDRWLNTFTEASARLDALQTAVTDLRHLLRRSEGVRSAEILEVLERHGVQHGPWRCDDDDTVDPRCGP